MRRGWWLAFTLAVAVWALLCVFSLYRGLKMTADQGTDNKSKLVEIPVESTSDTPSPVEVPEDSELYHMEAIEFYPVPMDHDLQAHIIRTCNHYGVDAVIVFAMIQRESNFDAAAIGDDGTSVGLMQIQEKWHSDRMAKLGVTDLLDPYQNVTVGIDFLAELLRQYPLTYYNSGKAEISSYSEAVMDYMESLTEVTE